MSYTGDNLHFNILLSSLFERLLLTIGAFILSSEPVTNALGMVHMSASTDDASALAGRDVVQTDGACDGLGGDFGEGDRGDGGETDAEILGGTVGGGEGARGLLVEEDGVGDGHGERGGDVHFFFGESARR